MCAKSSGSSDICIRWERRAVKEVAVLPKVDRLRIVEAVEGLADNPLKGKIMVAAWKGFRRLRVGSYRVVYAYDGHELLISVVRVGHRSQVYR
jgi:mRNA interferase RelE/StbE